jgi:hypothetical protein
MHRRSLAGSFAILVVLFFVSKHLISSYNEFTSNKILFLSVSSHEINVYDRMLLHIIKLDNIALILKGYELSGKITWQTDSKVQFITRNITKYFINSYKTSK